MAGERQDSPGSKTFNTINVRVFPPDSDEPLLSWSTNGNPERRNADEEKESRDKAAIKKKSFTGSTLDDLSLDELGRRGPKDNDDFGPKMEDFNSFEEYIEALVSHERESSKGRPKNGGQSSRRRSEAEEIKNSNSGSGAPKKEWTKAATSETNPKQLRKTSPEPDFPADDDLELFLNSLDNPDFEFSLDSILNEQDERMGGLSPGGNSENIAVSNENHKTVGVKEGGKKAKGKSPKSEDVPASSEWSKVSLELLTIPTLKSMLKERGLQVSGKKAELIDRYLTALDSRS